jgi:uncharacterized membrane protein
MEDSRRDIVKKIISTRLNIENYKLSIKKSGRKFWLILLCFNIGLIIISILSLLNEINDDLFSIKNIEIVIIVGSLIIIFIIYKTLKIKIGLPKIDKLKNKSDKELNHMLEESQDEEKNLIDEIKNRRAGTYATLIVIVTPFMISLIENISNYGYDISKILNSYVENRYQFELGTLFLGFFIIGELIGSPISQRKYERQQSELKHIVKDSFIINLNLSKLNPEMEDETN